MTLSTVSPAVVATKIQTKLVVVVGFLPLFLFAAFPPLNKRTTKKLSSPKKQKKPKFGLFAVKEFIESTTPTLIP